VACIEAHGSIWGNKGGVKKEGINGSNENSYLFKVCTGNLLLIIVGKNNQGGRQKGKRENRGIFVCGSREKKRGLKPQPRDFLLVREEQKREAGPGNYSWGDTENQVIFIYYQSRGRSVLSGVGKEKRHRPNGGNFVGEGEESRGEGEREGLYLYDYSLQA